MAVTALGTTTRKSLPGLLLAAAAAIFAIPFAVGQDHHSPGQPAVAGIHGHCLSETTELQPLGLNAMEVAGSSGSGEVSIACADGKLESIHASIRPGQEAMVMLLLRNDSDSPARFQIDSQAPDGSGQAADASWLSISPASGEIPPRTRFHVGLTLSVSGGLAPGSVRELGLKLRMSGAADELSTQLPLTMTVRNEQPLFRNRFEVDPVLGQFSQIDPATEGTTSLQ